MSASSVGLDNNAPRDEQTGMDKEKVRHLSGGIGKEWVTEGKKREEKEHRGKEERVSPESQPHVHPGTPQPLEGTDDSSNPKSRGIERWLKDNEH